MGGSRRDVGLLGNGIYFGDSVTTSVQYCNIGSRGTSMILVCNVALGSTKQFTTYQKGMNEAPSGYHRSAFPSSLPPPGFDLFLCFCSSSAPRFLHVLSPSRRFSIGGCLLMVGF